MPPAQADPSLVGQLRRLAAQLQQAADQIERLGTFLRPAEAAAGTRPMDEGQLIHMLLANQRGTQAGPQPDAAPRAGRSPSVADDLERLAALVRAGQAEPAAAPVDDQQLLSMLLNAQRGARPAPSEAERYARLIEMLSALNRR